MVKMCLWASHGRQTDCIAVDGHWQQQQKKLLKHRVYLFRTAVWFSLKHFKWNFHHYYYYLLDKQKQWTIFKFMWDQFRVETTTKSIFSNKTIMFCQSTTDGPIRFERFNEVTKALNSLLAIYHMDSFSVMIVLLSWSVMSFRYQFWTHYLMRHFLVLWFHTFCTFYQLNIKQISTLISSDEKINENRPWYNHIQIHSFIIMDVMY